MTRESLALKREVTSWLEGRWARTRPFGRITLSKEVARTVHNEKWRQTL